MFGRLQWEDLSCQCDHQEDLHRFHARLPLAASPNPWVAEVVPDRQVPGRLGRRDDTHHGTWPKMDPVWDVIPGASCVECTGRHAFEETVRLLQVVSSMNNNPLLLWPKHIQTYSIWLERSMIQHIQPPKSDSPKDRRYTMLSDFSDGEQVFGSPETLHPFVFGSIVRLHCLHSIEMAASCGFLVLNQKARLSHGRCLQ